MKNSIFILIVFASVVCSVSSCKKCYTCTKPTECGQCNHFGTLGAEVCSATIGQSYTTQKGDCIAAGDEWVITNYLNSVDDYCEKPSDNNGLNAQKTSCESTGGVWNSRK